jgi:UDP-glucuronate 4-epimerase
MYMGIHEDVWECVWGWWRALTCYGYRMDFFIPTDDVMYCFMHRRGDRVVVIDEMNDYYDLRLKHYNLSILKSSYDSDKLAVYNGDICDDNFLEEIFKKEALTHIIHLAARAGVRPSIHDPSLYVRTNVDGTSKLLDLARKFDIKNFVFASSSSVYGGSLKSKLFVCVCV